MATHDLLYIEANASVPQGRVTSTARRGVKWYAQTRVGDVVNLKVAETGQQFGQAVVVLREVQPLKVVLENADHNACQFGPKANGRNASDLLADELIAAYAPPLRNTELFTVLHLLPFEIDVLPAAAVKKPLVPAPLTQESVDEAANVVAEFSILSVSLQKANSALPDGTFLPRVSALEYTQRIGEVESTQRVEAD